MDAPGIILFDGVCTLCDHVVQLVLDHDPDGRFVFASLQSAEGRRVLASAGRAPLAEGAAPDSMVLVEGGKAYERSTAALRVARRMRFPWRALGVLLVVPRFVRDAVYDVVAKNRYRWFGRHDACRVPTPELRARFLENRPDLLQALG